MPSGSAPSSPQRLESSESTSPADAPPTAAPESPEDSSPATPTPSDWLRGTAFETVLIAVIAGGVVPFLVMLYEMHTPPQDEIFLTPPLVGLAGIVLLGESLLEQSVLTPNILSYQVGLHPLLVLFSLLTFGVLLGVFGLLIAVPVTAILVTGHRAYRDELTLDLSEYGTTGNAKTSRS